MPLKLVRNDITKMQVDDVVNTANPRPCAGPGCDLAIYQAAGYEKLLERRREIGNVEMGEVFLTDGYDLPARYIIHAVSPVYIDGESGEEAKLRSCYRKSLALAKQYGIHSIAFPLISSGSFGYPKAEALRIAMDEINRFLLKESMLVYIVVFGDEMTNMGRNLYPDLEAYIDSHYVEAKLREEYEISYENRRKADLQSDPIMPTGYPANRVSEKEYQSFAKKLNDAIVGKASDRGFTKGSAKDSAKSSTKDSAKGSVPKKTDEDKFAAEEAFLCSSELDSLSCDIDSAPWEDDFDEVHGSDLDERMKHLQDTYSEYLLYLIKKKGLSYPEVYNNACVDKRVFSKIKNDPLYHPQKMTAMCLCIGAKLNLDESIDLLARAGYALSPSDKTEIIFRYFLEKEIYDIFELDIQLENYGLPYLIA